MDISHQICGDVKERENESGLLTSSQLKIGYSQYLRVRLIVESIRMERRIKRSRFVICLIGEPYECKGEERKESVCVRGSARIWLFWRSWSI